RFVIITAIIAAYAVPVWATAVVPPMDYAGTPIEFGVNDLRARLARTPQAPEHVKVLVLLPGMEDGAVAKAAVKLLPKKDESFAIVRVGNDVVIMGRDE